jgi:hypothetical protein
MPVFRRTEQRKTEYLVAVLAEFSVQLRAGSDPLANRPKTSLPVLPMMPGNPCLASRRLRVGVCGPESWDGGLRLWDWGWLLIAERSSSETQDFSLLFYQRKSASVTETFVRLARRASRLDEFTRFAKGELGWNQYEGRPGMGSIDTLLVFSPTVS